MGMGPENNQQYVGHLKYFLFTLFFLILDHISQLDISSDK